MDDSLSGFDVGSWLSRQAVVLAITAVEQPDWAKKTFHVHLTKEQVRNSPVVDTDKPVSRQQEVVMKLYFGWPAHWEGAVHSTGDSHLRSVWHLADYQVWATDGEIGRLAGFIMDDASCYIGYLDVKAGDWLHSALCWFPLAE